MVAFDWYQATVWADHSSVLDVLMGAAEGATLRHTKGVQGYATCTKVETTDGRMGEVEVWHGGSQGHPHVRLTSDAAAWGAEVVRSAFPEHSVTRVDVKADYAAPDAFDRMLPAVLDAAKRHRIKVDTRGDHLLRREARTVFLGSPSSAVRLRQYDKAAELRAKFARNPVKLAEVPENLTRLEVQVRPVGLAIRRACASQPPLAFLGVSAWTREIWREIEGQELQPLQVTKAWRQSDDDRTYDYLLDKFGPLLLRKIEEHGSAHCFALQLQHDLAERQAAKRRRH